MNYQTFFNEIQKILSANPNIRFRTLGGRASFTVEIRNGIIYLINSRGSRNSMTKQDFDICKKQYCDLMPPERFKGKNYTDPVLRIPIERIHSPLIPALFKYLCEHGKCICEC